MSARSKERWRKCQMGALLLHSIAIVRNATCEIGNISDSLDDYYIVYNRDDTQKCFFFCDDEMHFIEINSDY